MHRIVYHRRAEKALRRMPSQRAAQILLAVEELAIISEPSEHPHVKKMRGESEKSYRLRVGSYRVIFRLYPEGGDDVLYLILVTHAGNRGDIY